MTSLSWRSTGVSASRFVALAVGLTGCLTLALPCAAATRSSKKNDSASKTAAVSQKSLNGNHYIPSASLNYYSDLDQSGTKDSATAAKPDATSQVASAASAKKTSRREKAALTASAIRDGADPQVVTVSAADNPSDADFSVASAPRVYYQNASNVAGNGAQASIVTADNPQQGLLKRLLNKATGRNAQPTSQVQTAGGLTWVPSKLSGQVQSGSASWYGSDFHGGRTANGERYDMYSMTAAHRSLPFNTLIKVTNQSNGRECIVRINNRGPYSGGRILDLSKAAASELGFLGKGVTRVSMTVLGRKSS